MTTIEWQSGLNNYRTHTLEFFEKSNNFTLELHDVELQNFNTVQDAFAAHLSGASLPIEVLYSGGLDSECVIDACLQKNIPVVAVTMRLLVRDNLINEQDLFYAKRFCENRGIKHVIHDLKLDTFFGNGEHIQYVEPYRITHLPAATVLWLITQCQSFPVVGGDYSWPQTNIGRKIYSPHRHDYNCHDHFMRSRGINGIGNMMSHSLDSNVFFIKSHLQKFSDHPDYKVHILSNLGFNNLEARVRSHGWEKIDEYKKLFDWREAAADLEQRHHSSMSTVVWNQTLANLIDGEPGTNHFF